MGHPGLFFILVSSFQANIAILQQIYEKNVYPVYSAGIEPTTLGRYPPPIPTRPGIPPVIWFYLKT